MKNSKFIPFIALGAMLSACTLSNGSAKMKKYSNEISFEDWNTGISEAMGEDEGDPSDVQTVTNISMKMSEKHNRGDKVISSATTDASGTMKSKYDADTDVAYSEASIKGTAKGNEGSTTLNYEAKGSIKRYYQTKTVTETVGDVEQEVKKTISVNKDQKEYYFQTGEVESAAMQYAAGPVLALAFLPMSYGYATEEEKADYKFYQDGNMFTAVYSTTEEEDNNMNVNGETVTYRHDVTVQTSIIQLEVKKSGDKVSSMTIRYEQKEEVTRNYLYNYSARYLEGDVEINTEDMVYVVTVSMASVKLQPVDLTGYIDGGEDAEIGFGS